MKVAVIGPGAMGCLYAAKIARGGIDTVLVDHRSDRAARLTAKGIKIEAPEGEYTTEIKVVSSVPINTDLAIVLVKSSSTSSLVFNGKTTVLTIQNGLGNVETLCSTAGSANLLAGVTSEAATLLDEGHVRHTARGLTRFGGWTSCPVAAAQQVLTKAGFQIEITDSPGQVIWEKAAINSAINPLTALLNITNGQLLEIPEVRQLMRYLVVEAVKVASTEGYRFAHSVVELTEMMCTQTSENVSSMLQDVRAGKPTEIDAISGEIVRRGLHAALPTPRTRVVWQLVKGLEKR